MQQRVGVVRALANEPDVLLMDEPFASVDAQTRMTLQEELTRIWQERRPTVIFITHDVAEAVFLANRVVVLSKGACSTRSRRPAAARGSGTTLVNEDDIQGACRRACCNWCVRHEPCLRDALGLDARTHRPRRRRRLGSAWQLWLTLAAPGKIRPSFGRRSRKGQRTGHAAVPAGAVSRSGVPDNTAGCPAHKTIRSKCAASNERTSTPSPGRTG